MISKDAQPMQRGLTLVGLMIAMAVSSVIVMAVAMLLKTSVRSYSAQKEIRDTEFTSSDVARTLGDVISEAGGGIPLAIDSIISVSTNGETLTVKYNLLGGMLVAPENDVGDNIIEVEDARWFFGLKNLKYLADDGTVYDISIDTTENTGNFINGVDTTRLTCGYTEMGCGEMDSIALTSPIDLQYNESVYAQEIRRYWVDHSTDRLIQEIDGVATPLADGIEEVSFTFYDWSGTTQTDFNQMATCSLVVIAKGSHEAGYSGTSDQHRRDTTARLLLLRGTRL